MYLSDCRWFENLLEETVIKNFCSGAGEWDDKMSTIPEDIQSLVSSDTIDISVVTDIDILNARRTSAHILDVSIFVQNYCVFTLFPFLLSLFKGRTRIVFILWEWEDLQIVSHYFNLKSVSVFQWQTQNIFK